MQSSNHPLAESDMVVSRVSPTAGTFCEPLDLIDGHTDVERFGMRSISYYSPNSFS